MSDWDRYSSETDVTGRAYQSDYQEGGEHETASGITGRARMGMDQMRHGAQDMSGRALHGFDRYFHRHPILFGVGAMALGVAVGMILPSTRPEERWMGDASERVKERTREAAGKVGDVARTSFEEARDTAKQELEERGLDAEHIKEGANKAADEAKEIAQKSAQEARRAAQKEAKGSR